MVTYSPSSTSKQIIVSELVYSTQLTFSVPANVTQKSGFLVTGKLTFMEGGVYYGLSGKTINFAGGGISSSATTITDGTFSKTLYIDTVGTFTITASYAGEAGLLGISTSGEVGVTEIAGANIIPLLLFLGVGGVMILASKSRNK